MITAIAGGVGGAKMAHGLWLDNPDESLRVIVNTADDFSLYGLHISPDVDTVMYTLAGIANPVSGWGIEGDTFKTLGGIAKYGEEPWFTLGDRDFATHILRTEALANGNTLTQVTSWQAIALGVDPIVMPMTNDGVRTIIETPQGSLTFQDYFVKRRQQDEVTNVEFDGIEDARPTSEVLESIRDANILVFCPSNPIVSIGPILALDGVRNEITSSRAVRVAVSPLIAGKAVKGPADRMMATMGHESSSLGVARIYQGLIDGFVIDHHDQHLKQDILSLGIDVLVADTLMKDESDRKRLGHEVLQYARSLPERAES